MSIYLGNTKIGQMYLGSTEIAEAYLGSTKVYQKLPYDAQVEYLQSSGTQYIDTGIYGNPQTASEVRFNADTGSPSTLFGCYFSASDRSLTISVGNNIAQRFHNTVCNATVPFDLDTTVLTNKNGVTVNGVFTSRETPSSFTTNYTLYLFRINGSTVTTYFKGKYYYCKIWDNGVLVRDFIPVRKGNVGYMYDKVSGQLFGNAGTGDYILGQDIVPVEYLESDGNAYIKTGLSLNFSNGNNIKWLSKIGISNSTNTRRFLISADGREDRNFYCEINASNKFAVGTGVTAPALNIGQMYDCEMNTIIGTSNNAKIYSSGNEYSATTTSYITGVTSPEYDLVLFRINDRFKGSGHRIGANKVYYNNVLLRDFIPVRVGSTGYMYDKVSNRLFGNAGTGSFTLGNDITI